MTVEVMKKKKKKRKKQRGKNDIKIPQDSRVTLNLSINPLLEEYYLATCRSASDPIFSRVKLNCCRYCGDVAMA